MCSSRRSMNMPILLKILEINQGNNSYIFYHYRKGIVHFFQFFVFPTLLY